MPTINRSLNDWRQRNLERASGGELRVRGCLRKAPEGLSGISTCVATFRVLEPTTGNAYIYQIYSGFKTTVLCSDETDYFGRSIYSRWPGMPGIPTHVTWAVVDGQLIIASPGAPVLWGYPGQHLRVMPKGTSVISTKTTLGIPQGQVTEWARRLVLTDGNFIYVSDPGLPRAFTASNQIGFNSSIFGIHTAGDGDLYILREDAVWALPRAAALRGQQVEFVLYKVVDFPSTHLGQAVSAHGRLWALTKRGIRLIDTPDTETEIHLSDPPGAGAGQRIHRKSWADGSCRLFATSDGLMVSAPEGMCNVDLETGDISWWTVGSGISGDTRLSGTFTDSMGRGWVGLANSGIYLPLGSSDANGDEDGTALRGGLRGSLTTTAISDLGVLQQVHTAVGGNSYCAMGGTVHDVDERVEGAEEGTSEWTSATTLREKRLQHHTHYYGKDREDRGPEKHMEVGGLGSGTEVAERMTVFSDDRHRQGKDQA